MSKKTSILTQKIQVFTMKTIQAYETSDHTLFRDKILAEKHQKSIDITEQLYILAGGSLPTEFCNGDGYYQLTQATYIKMLNLIEELKIVTDTPLEYSITSRYCADNRETAIAGSLMACIDQSTLRRYGQLYYKPHPQNCTSQKDWSQQ